MMHKRGVGALVRRSLDIRLDCRQPMSRVHDGCCGVSVILCSVGQPCLNPNIERGSKSPTFRSILVFVANTSISPTITTYIRKSARKYRAFLNSQGGEAKLNAFFHLFFQCCKACKRFCIRVAHRFDTLF
mgnify:FL=1